MEESKEYIEKVGKTTKEMLKLMKGYNKNECYIIMDNLKNLVDSSLTLK